MGKKIELLAPAGSLANLKAAIVNGADAVYLGMNKFGARAYAKNFNSDFLKKAVQICKSNNVKLFLTMNTLIKNEELSEFFKQLNYAYKCGIDAVIIQDCSFIDLIKNNYPDLKVHISTQTGVMNSFHANILKDADRINLARELNKSNIKFIRKNFGKELEIFVHGALCVSISGSCLFSSFIGGRSGNRGKCAQPCRKKYSGCFYLSTKELNLLAKIPELIEKGIDSIKIEGRMRTPYYVATTTSVYRKAIDDFYSGKFKITPEMKEKLKSAFSRDFTEGCYSSEDVFNREKATGESKVIEKEYEVPIKFVLINRQSINFKVSKIPEKEAEEKRLFVRVYNFEDGIVASENGADIVYLDLFDKDFVKLKNKIKSKLYAVTPRIMFDSDVEKIKERIKEISPDGLLAGNLGVLGFKLKMPIHLDYNCNCFNDLNLNYLETLGAFPIISPELSIKEQSEFKNKNFASFVHGKIRLMTLVHKFDKNEIEDEKGFKFFINPIFNGFEILNEKELGLFNKCKNLRNSGIVNFFIDTEKDVGKIVKIYRQILDGKTVDVSKIKNNYVLGWSEKGVL